MPSCPNCDEKVSSTETKCPHCGERLRSQGSRKGGSKKSKSSGTSTGTVIAIIAAALFGGLFVCGGIGAALLLPAVQQAREAARRTQCKNNLKQIGLAMHNYHDLYQLFPAAHLNDDNGQPRLSWRVSILPYLDENTRFQSYAFNEAWDSPSNSRLLSPMPRVYSCPSNPNPGNINTCYATFTDPDAALGDGKCKGIRDITDGTSNTLLVVEACGLNIPWMKPQDIDATALTRIGDPNGSSSKHIGGVHVLLADGSVRFISQNVDPKLVKQLITANGHEQIGDF